MTLSEGQAKDKSHALASCTPSSLANLAPIELPPYLGCTVFPPTLLSHMLFPPRDLQLDYLITFDRLLLYFHNCIH